MNIEVLRREAREMGYDLVKMSKVREQSYKKVKDIENYLARNAISTLKEMSNELHIPKSSLCRYLKKFEESGGDRFTFLRGTVINNRLFKKTRTDLITTKEVSK